MEISINGKVHKISPILLRDLCMCSSCVNPSTKQKEFSTTEIPAEIQAAEVQTNADTISIRWKSDIPNFDSKHETVLPMSYLQTFLSTGRFRGVHRAGPRAYWTADEYKQLSDFDYESYMNDDSVLLTALRQLHTHGLLFVTKVPEKEISVTTVAERIGPLKSTFYGYTWEVRSVPNAINVAYTSANLGFHMDLMYMVQPPHLQLLHCMRSSSAGGASLFTDSFRAVDRLSREDPDAFETLSSLSVDFHYDHPGAQYYHQRRKVIEQQPLKLGQTWVSDYRAARELCAQDRRLAQSKLRPMDFVHAVSWAPPFQGPFSLGHQADFPPESPEDGLSQHTARWHAAAQKFDALVHEKEAIFERMMKPGECVIFDNRRVLHARTAFDVDDAGKERWLRGAYIDKDPYLSKWAVLEDARIASG